MKITPLISIILIWVLASGGCGGSNNTQCTSAPDGAGITVTPATDPIKNSSTATQTVSHIFKILVKDSGGLPLNNKKITISYNIQTFPATYPSGVTASNLVALYDGTTPMPSPFDVCTDSFGIYYLYANFQTGGGLSYSGTITVYSGTATQTATFTIS